MHRKHTGKNRVVALGLAAALLFSVGVSAQSEEDVYGPVNLLKTLKTPFGGGGPAEANDGGLAPMTLTRSHSALQRGLASRLIQSRLYLPGRMVLSRPTEFVVKGKPGQWVALAMADKNTGAKPIYGQNLRLGADRKVVAVGQIPESGVAALVFETPVQGDLIGERWFFEAALWSRPDFSDLEIAQCVPADATAAAEADKLNGVLVAADIEQKKGVRFVPDAVPPSQRRAAAPYTLDSGRP